MTRILRTVKTPSGDFDVRDVHSLHGDAGALATLRRMAALVNQSLADATVRDAAQQIVRYEPVRDDVGQALAIRQWLGDKVQFIPDPRGVEVLTSPAQMLRDIDARGVTLGDCDNAAVLGAALGKAIGLRAQFVVLGFVDPKAPYTHVYARLQTRNGWVELDTTRPPTWPRGLLVTRSHFVEV